MTQFQKEFCGIVTKKCYSWQIYISAYAVDPQQDSSQKITRLHDIFAYDLAASDGNLLVAGS